MTPGTRLLKHCGSQPGDLFVRNPEHHEQIVNNNNNQFIKVFQKYVIFMSPMSTFVFSTSLRNK